jgi:hypothetical protein
LIVQIKLRKKETRKEKCILRASETFRGFPVQMAVPIKIYKQTMKNMLHATILKEGGKGFVVESTTSLFVFFTPKWFQLHLEEFDEKQGYYKIIFTTKKKR